MYVLIQRRLLLQHSILGLARAIEKRKRAEYIFALTLTFLAVFVSRAGAFAPPHFNGSDYLLRAWGTEEGLPENSATAIAQNQGGYLWFGTFNGLVRFNGVTFTVFNPANTPQLPHAGIVNLYTDKRDRLWVSTLEGLVVKDGTHWRALGTNEGWAGNYVRTFVQRANGDLLITTFDGHVLLFENDRLIELPPPAGEAGQGYLGTVDENGQWWLVQSHFVGRWNGQQWVLAHTPSPSLGRSEVACAPARGGGVWVLLAKELLKFRGGKEVSRLFLPQLNGGIWSISEDSRMNLWICSYDSCLFQLTPGGNLRHWTTTNGFGSASIRVVFEDQEENLWIGSSGGGLRKMTPRRFYEVNTGGPHPWKVARSVWPARDQAMWIAFYDAGLFRHDETGITRVLVPGPKNESTYGQAVLEDRTGRLWYGDLNNCWWRNGQDRFQKVPLPSVDRANITALFEDSKGRIWMATREGAVVYDGRGFEPLGSEAGLPPGGITCFGEDTAGRLWIAGSKGVFRQEQERFIAVHGADGQPLPDVLSLKAEANGSMWMGTRAAGLIRWRSGKMDRIGADDGLPECEIRGIIEDEQGYFWMPSNRGILHTSRQQLHAVAGRTVPRLECQIFDQNDGLSSAECFTGQPTSARDAAGRIWFATQKGVAVIDPAQFRLNSHPPPVQVEKLTYCVPLAKPGPKEHRALGASGRNEVHFTAPFPLPLRLPPGSYGLEIEYAALSYCAPEKVQFQYKLEGSGQDWKDVRNRRIARFYQIQPGAYVFRVRAANNDGVWNETGASLVLTVLPYYWQTGWFRFGTGLVLFALGGALAWSYSLRRVARASERERVAQELAEAHQRMNLAAEAADLGFWAWDMPHGQVWATDRCRELLGFSPNAEISSTTFFVHVAPEDQDSVRQAMDQAFGGNLSYDIQFRVNLPDNQVRWIAARGCVELNEHRQPRRIRGVCADITERHDSANQMRQLREELAHSSRVSTMGQLASALAHELSQPLSAILRNAEAAELLLEQNPADLAEFRAILADILQDEQRASGVIDRMRALLKRRNIEQAPLSVDDLVQEVAGLIRSDAHQRKVQMAIDVLPGLPQVVGDRIQLQQVLLNLLLNAMDAMSQQPADTRRLTVQVRRSEGRMVEVRVQDSGPGIPAPRLVQLFEPFFTTKANGMGLGLPISRTIIEAHHGRIWGENRPEGGAYFCFTLPMAEEAISNQ